MRFILIVLLAVFAVASAKHRRPFIPYNNRPFPQSPDDEYAASLSGAPLGLYEKRQGTFYGPRGSSYSSGSEAYGLSLGNARVGLYGKEQHRLPNFGFSG